MNTSFDHKNPKHLLSLLGTLVILAVIPITAYLISRSDESAKSPKAATIIPNTLDNLIATRGNHQALHEIRLAYPMYDWSWGRHSTEDGKSGGGSLNAWLATQRDASQMGTTFNAKVVVKNMRMYVHKPGGGWVQGMNGMPSWIVSSNPETNGDYRDIGHSVEADGSWSFDFPPNRSLHMAQNSPGYVTSFADGVATVVEARVIGPDAHLTKWGMNSGADWKAADGGAPAIAPSAGIGQYGLLTGEYRSYVMLSSVLSDAQVRADPPPTFTTGSTPVDTTPPQVTITSPASGASLSGTTTVAATATDETGGSGLANVVFAIDGTAVKTITAPATYSFSLDTNTLSNASHTIRATAKDKAGNSSFNERTVTVNNVSVPTAPVISTLNSTTTENSATVSWVTNQVATTQLVYGTTTSYGQSAPTNTTLSTSHSITLSGLASNTTYYFKATSANSAGQSTNATGSFVTKAATTAGFKVDYFNNKTFTGTPVASKTLTGSSLNFNWAGQSPATGVNSTNWSAVFTGTFVFDAAKFRFNSTVNDGVRIYVDGTRVVDGWKDQSATTYNGLKTLTAGTHSVRVEYFQSTNQSSLLANWVHADNCNDMTGDGSVTNADLSIVGNHFAEKGALPWDVNNDQSVNIIDLLRVSQSIGTSCT